MCRCREAFLSLTSLFGHEQPLPDAAGRARHRGENQDASVLSWLGSIKFAAIIGPAATDEIRSNLGLGPRRPNARDPIPNSPFGAARHLHRIGVVVSDLGDRFSDSANGLNSICGSRVRIIKRLRIRQAAVAANLRQYRSANRKRELFKCSPLFVDTSASMKLANSAASAGIGSALESPLALGANQEPLRRANLPRSARAWAPTAVSGHRRC